MMLKKHGITPYESTRVQEYKSTHLISGLYAIADSGFCKDNSLSEFARKLLQGGCRLIQLRMKKEPSVCHCEVTKQSPVNNGLMEIASVTSFPRNDTQIKEIAREIVNLKKEYDFTFILNDHADLALEVGADGVHVGENDEPIEKIRKRAGDKLIIGYSSHSIEEAIRAQDAGADYVAFGAIFPTKTKGPGHPVQGLEKLREVVRALKVPVVAIGGVSRENVRDVVATGAKAIAMISALAEAEDIAVETKFFVDIICDDITHRADTTSEGETPSPPQKPRRFPSPVSLDE